jgi:hypothetical protein
MTSCKNSMHVHFSFKKRYRTWLVLSLEITVQIRVRMAKRYRTLLVLHVYEDFYLVIFVNKCSFLSGSNLYHKQTA